MKLAMIGLGKMGGNMVARLLRQQIEWSVTTLNKNLSQT